MLHSCRMEESSMSVRRRRWGDDKEAWIVDYSDGQGVRHLKTFDKKKEADAFHDSVRVDVRAGVHTSTKVTVEKAAADWLASCEANRLERTSLDSYRQHYADHIRPYLGAVKLSALNVPTIRA